MEKYKKRPHSWLGKQTEKNAFQEAKSQKRFAFAATNETSSRQHQRPRCALPPPSSHPLSLPLPFLAAACGELWQQMRCNLPGGMWHGPHTRLDLARLTLCTLHCLHRPLPYPACCCCTPYVDIYVYLYLCSARPMVRCSRSEYLCYGQCLFYLSYMSRLVAPTPPLLPPCSNVLYELSLWWPHSGIYCIFFLHFLLNFLLFSLKFN